MKTLRRENILRSDFFDCKLTERINILKRRKKECVNEQGMNLGMEAQRRVTLQTLVASIQAGVKGESFGTL